MFVVLLPVLSSRLSG